MSGDEVLVAGPCRLDLRDERLWINGAPVVLGGKSLGLLRALMLRPQVLVTKDDLFDAVWPGVTVSESVLTTAAKEVRKALGDDARRPRFVETVHGRGYRFLLPVERLAVETPGVAAARVVVDVAPPVVVTRRRLWGIMAVLGIIVAAFIGILLWRTERAAVPATVEADPKSVAVLPFDDFSPNSDQRWFAEGLTEEIQNRLALTPDLKVTSRMAAAQVRKANTGVMEAARLLKVSNILEGSVRRSGDRVRVTVELVRAPDGFQIWSQNYDRPVGDIITIQEDIAFEIATAMKTVMNPARLRAMVDVGTRSVEAYEAYLRGLALDQRQLVEGDVVYARGAADAYERARLLDPNFAAAHWKSARTWFGNATRIDARVRGDRLSEETRLAGYFERVDVAIAASKDDTERLKYRAARAVMQLQFKAAHQLMAAYLKVRPRDIDAWEMMGDLSAYAGEPAWMVRAAERIQTLSIEGGNPVSRAITLSVMAAQMPEAAARARRQLVLRPTNAITQYQAHRALIWNGEAGAARALLGMIDASTMPGESKLLARMRQACADGETAPAMALRNRIDAVGDLTSKWQAAQLMRDTARATALLRPLDRPDRLATLMQFMIHPTFDARLYPGLNAALVRSGVVPRRPIATPYACGAGRGIAA